MELRFRKRRTDGGTFLDLGKCTKEYTEDHIEIFLEIGKRIGYVYAEVH